MSIVKWLSFASLVFVVAGVVVVAIDIRRAYARVADASVLIASPHGDIEFKQAGSGVPVLVVHGSGGGFDQGELIAEAVLGDGFHWIAPSRFGYLRSTVPVGATFDDQARAYARLLDTLGIDTVAVLALSHGGPSALLFAVLYPERVSSLSLLSCGVASSSDGDQAEASRKGDTLTRIFKYDVLYWSVSTLWRKQLMALMGADDAVIAGLTGGQRALVDRVIDDMNPVATRYAGVMFDNTAAMPNERIAAVRAPTLVIHAKDDSLQLYRNAEVAAATIPGARLLAFDKGGHLLIAVEQSAIRAEVQAFIRANVSK
ncbi:MAG: alpha/beta fold hydrolase [Acidobacteria bacterium]|nr:alpha/beta fold hydrolase [Acidobacteriota bacterium]